MFYVVELLPYLIFFFVLIGIGGIAWILGGTQRVNKKCIYDLDKRNVLIKEYIKLIIGLAIENK